MKHLPLFHQSRDSRSKDENKNEKVFLFISPAIKTIVNRTFLTAKLSFEVLCKHPLSQIFYNDIERS